MKRATSQFGVHAKVPVSSVKDSSGGSRKYGSIAAGTRLRFDIEVEDSTSGLGRKRKSALKKKLELLRALRHLARKSRSQCTYV